MPTQTRVFAPYAATEPHGVGDRATRRVYMRCAECGVLPVATGARGVSPKMRPPGGVWSGRLRCEGGNAGAVVCGGAVGDRHVGALPVSGASAGAVGVACSYMWSSVQNVTFVQRDTGYKIE